MRLHVIFIVFLLLTGCTKTEYIIEEPVSTDLGNSPAGFNVTLGEVSDRWAYIGWEINQDNADGQVKYEIAVNDSVVAYDYEVNTYRLNDLKPNTKYSVSVIALDSLRNATSVHIEVQTMKSFVEGVISFDLNFEYFTFNKIAETDDNGLLIGGSVTEKVNSEANLAFVLKLDDTYNIEFLHIFQSTDPIVELLQSKDDNYVVVRGKSVCKINKSGNELWTYHNDFDTGSLSSAQCATQDLDGNYIIAGISNRNWGADISTEYSLFKLSENGELLWNKFGGTTLSNSPKDVLVDSRGRILIFGSAEYTGVGFDQLSYIKNGFWLSWSDENGNFLNQKFYENKYSNSDIPFSISQTIDGNYLLIGTAAGSMPPYGYSNTEPRFLKVNTEGDLIWDQYHYLNSGGVFPSVRGFTPKSNGGQLILTGDDRGIAISSINSLGELENHIKLYGYPGCIFIKTVENENYHCITGDGRIILFNHDGYIE